MRWFGRKKVGDEYRAPGSPSSLWLKALQPNDDFTKEVRAELDAAPKRHVKCAQRIPSWEACLLMPADNIFYQ